MARNGTSVGQAFFDVLANFDGFGESLQRGVVEAVSDRGTLIARSLETLGNKLITRFTIPFAAGAAANIAQFQGLQRSIAETLTLFGTGGPLIDETFDRMEKGIRGVSTAVGGLERDIADGLYQTISAGVPGPDAFQFLEVAQIAAIADKTSDLTTAVDGITTAINAYKLEFTDADEVSDQFFATVARGKTTFGELSSDLGRVAPLAANAGVELGETLAIIGQLTVQGLKTSEAISFLRAAITGVLRPTDELNAVFENLGFSSAETAIPVLGLQGAFEAVVDSAHGSTSALQELIGTSEGVTAILGVTGDNADNFASILNSVENSAGRSADAFAIVDSTVSRSFGKLTEGFDRLGNLFGGLGAQIVQPLVDALTGIINELINIFEAATPYIEVVIAGIRKLFSALENPALQKAVAGFAAITLSLGGMLAVVGGLIRPFGTMIRLLIALGTNLGIFKIVLPTLKRVQQRIAGLGNAMLKLADNITGTNFATKQASKSLKFFGRTMAVTKLQLAAFGVGMAAVAAAIVGAIVVAKEWSEALGNIDEKNLLASQGLERLASSLGATIDPLAELVSVADNVSDVDVNFAFELQNPNLLDKIREVQAELGQDAAEDYVISIAAQLSSRGATVEDIGNFIDRISGISDIGIDLDLSSVMNEIDAGGASIRGLDLGLQQLLATAQGSDFELRAPFGALVPQIRDTQTQVRNLADELVNIRLTEGAEEFQRAFALIESQVAGTELENFFADTIVDAFEAAGGSALDFSKRNIVTFRDLDAQLQENLPTIKEMAGALDEVARPRDITGGLASDIETYGIQIAQTIPGIIRLTDQQASTLVDLKGQIDSVFQAGQDYVTETFNNIRNGMLSQMPLLGIYGGAVEQSFAEWKKGQDRFQEDIVQITEVRERIQRQLPKELAEAFDNASIGEQAWLAALSPEDLETALAELAESFSIVNENAEERLTQVPDIMDGVYNAMHEQYLNLYGQAAEAGTEVANLWNINFERQSAEWVFTAADIMAQVRGIISGHIDPPSLGGLSLGGISRGDTGVGTDLGDLYGGGGGNITINNYNPTTQSIVEDTDKALRLAETYHRRGRR